MDNTKITNTFNTLFGKLSVTFRHLHQTCRITMEHIRKIDYFLHKLNFFTFLRWTENFGVVSLKTESGENWMCEGQKFSVSNSIGNINNKK